jgi:hypothetical protein
MVNIGQERDSRYTDCHKFHIDAEVQYPKVVYPAFLHIDVATLQNLEFAQWFELNLSANRQTKEGKEHPQLDTLTACVDMFHDERLIASSETTVNAAKLSIAIPIKARDIRDLFVDRVARVHPPGAEVRCVAKIKLSGSVKGENARFSNWELLAGNDRDIEIRFSMLTVVPFPDEPGTSWADLLGVLAYMGSSDKAMEFVAACDETVIPDRRNNPGAYLQAYYNALCTGDFKRRRLDEAYLKDFPQCQRVLLPWQTLEERGLNCTDGAFLLGAALLSQSDDHPKEFQCALSVLLLRAQADESHNHAILNWTRRDKDSDVEYFLDVSQAVDSRVEFEEAWRKGAADAGNKELYDVVTRVPLSGDLFDKIRLQRDMGYDPPLNHALGSGTGKKKVWNRIISNWKLVALSSFLVCLLSVGFSAMWLGSNSRGCQPGGTSGESIAGGEAPSVDNEMDRKVDGTTSSKDDKNQQPLATSDLHPADVLAHDNALELPQDSSKWPGILAVKADSQARSSSIRIQIRDFDYKECGDSVIGRVEYLLLLKLSGCLQKKQGLPYILIPPAFARGPATESAACVEDVLKTADGDHDKNVGTEMSTAADVEIGGKVTCAPDLERRWNLRLSILVKEGKYKNDSEYELLFPGLTVNPINSIDYNADIMNQLLGNDDKHHPGSSVCTWKLTEALKNENGAGAWEDFKTYWNGARAFDKFASVCPIGFKSWLESCNGRFPLARLLIAQWLDREGGKSHAVECLKVKNDRRDKQWDNKPNINTENNNILVCDDVRLPYPEQLRCKSLYNSLIGRHGGAASEATELSNAMPGPQTEFFSAEMRFHAGRFNKITWNAYKGAIEEVRNGRNANTQLISKALNHLALAQAYWGDFHSAEIAGKCYESVATDKSNTYDTQAEIYMHKGDLAKARGLYGKLIRKKGKQPDFQRISGVVLNLLKSDILNGSNASFPSKETQTILERANAGEKNWSNIPRGTAKEQKTSTTRKVRYFLLETIWNVLANNWDIARKSLGTIESSDLKVVGGMEVKAYCQLNPVPSSDARRTWNPELPTTLEKRPINPDIALYDSLCCLLASKKNKFCSCLDKLGFPKSINKHSEVSYFIHCMEGRTEELTANPDSYNRGFKYALFAYLELSIQQARTVLGKTNPDSLEIIEYRLDSVRDAFHFNVKQTGEIVTKMGYWVDVLDAPLMLSRLTYGYILLAGAWLYSNPTKLDNLVSAYNALSEAKNALMGEANNVLWGAYHYGPKHHWLSLFKGQIKNMADCIQQLNDKNAKNKDLSEKIENLQEELQKVDMPTAKESAIGSWTSNVNKSLEPVYGICEVIEQVSAN